MRSENILKKSEVYDEGGKIRPRFVPRDDSGWVPHGRYTVLRDNARPLLEITYRHGLVHGPYFEYWPSGKVACEGQFQEGKQEGIWHFYNEDGTLMEVVQFKEGKESGPFSWEGKGM